MMMIVVVICPGCGMYNVMELGYLVGNFFDVDFLDVFDVECMGLG